MGFKLNCRKTGSERFPHFPLNVWKSEIQLLKVAGKFLVLLLQMPPDTKAK